MFCLAELGQLDRRQREFEQRGVQVVAVSTDDLEHAARVQERFPGLVVVSDARRILATRLAALHRGAGPGGADIYAPMMILVDGRGLIRWVYRPPHVATRLGVDDVLRAVDGHLGRSL